MKSFKHRIANHGTRLCILAAAFIVVSSGPGNGAATETLFDLVPQFAPAATKKQVPVFHSQHFESGSGCLLDYRSVARHIKTNWRQISDANVVADLFRQSPVFVTTWWSDPSLCSETAKVASGPNWIKLSVGGPTDVAQALTIMPGKLVMRERAIEQFTKQYGAPFFRARESSPDRRFNMMTFYAAVRMPEGKRIALSDYSSLSLTIDAQLDSSNIMTDCVAGTPPEGAKNCYDPRRMASQFRVAFGNIIWRDARCRARDQADPVCQYQGRYMQVSLSLHDERFPFYNDDFYVQHGDARTPGATIPIFRIDLRHFLPAATTANPFHIVGNRAVAQGDLLAALRKGLLLAEAQGHLPPRLTMPDGSKESDDRYLSHYSLASMDIGYEVSGLSDMTYTIFQLSLRGVPKH